MLKKVSIRKAWGAIWDSEYYQLEALVTCTDKVGKPNIIAVGWSMPTSWVPPMIAISIGKTRYSHDLIAKQKEFGMCFPTADMIKETLYCGTRSGRDVDKFKETGLKPIKSAHIKPPLIDGCVINLECKLVGSLSAGDHTIFAGEIVAAYISTEKKNKLFDLGGGKGYNLGVLP